MKTKIKTTVIFALFLLMSNSSNAQSISVGNIEGKQGESAKLNITLTNGTTKVSGFQCDIELPEGVAVEQNNKGKYQATLSESRKDDHTLSVSLQSDGSFRFMSYSPENNWYDGEDGIIASSNIILNAEPGEYTVTVKNASFTDVENLTKVNCSESTATLTILPQEINLVHGETYAESAKKENVTVNYTRNFSHSNWQALYVPFAMKYDDWKNIGKVAEFSKVEEDVIVWNIVESGAISANTPYLFKPNATGEVTFTSENVDLEPATEASVSDGGFSITGIYSEKTDMYTTGAYGLHEGTFYQASSNSQTLSPYQIFLTVPSPSGKTRSFSNGIGSEGTTSIKIIGVNKQEDELSYDLNGRVVSSPNNAIIIENGKKILNKK